MKFNLKIICIIGTVVRYFEFTQNSPLHLAFAAKIRFCRVEGNLQNLYLCKLAAFLFSNGQRTSVVKLITTLKK